MCGIAGKLCFDQERAIEPAIIRRMTRVIAHRGPDADGFFEAPGIALGHRRLSIIDVAGGDQPIANEDGTVQVVFNGEIYNFAEIRAELDARGHRFRTHTDTEVIAHAYEEWGEASVSRFRGMFAYAIWDASRRRLVLARDRIGVKPLYYWWSRGGITFGSELKALLADPDVPLDWSPTALDAYLALGYIPAPGTIYREIRKLPAGHLLVAEGDRVALRQYWDLTFTGDGSPVREDEYLAQLDALLSESVRLRLISDVPLGAFLSGGIDSSAVVAVMAHESASPVVTMSVGFAERAFSELEDARAVAAHLGTQHHEDIVTPELADLLPRIAWHFDEPFGDSSAVPTFYVSQSARRLVTVALSGDGGDELWAGYARHRVERQEIRARRWLGPVGRRAAGLVGAALPLDVKGARSLRHLALPPGDACARKHSYGLFENRGRRALYSGDFARTVRPADPLEPLRAAWDACGSPDPLDRALYVDVKTYLVDDIMTKVDRMSMAVSLEAREPLLDHRLLEFAAGVPTALKLRNGRTKYLLRRLLERRVPPAIVNRPKHGFEAPTAQWLRGPLAPLVSDLLFDGRLRSRGLFDARRLAAIWTEHRAGRRNHQHRLWSLMMLELWFRQYADGAASASAREMNLCVA